MNHQCWDAILEAILFMLGDGPHILCFRSSQMGLVLYYDWPSHVHLWTQLTHKERIFNWFMVRIIFFKWWLKKICSKKKLKIVCQNLWKTKSNYISLHSIQKSLILLFSSNTHYFSLKFLLFSHILFKNFIKIGVQSFDTLEKSSWLGNNFSFLF